MEDIHNGAVVPENRPLEIAKDLTAGAAGGVVQVLIGQPFDLVKVRLQTQGTGSIVTTIRNIWTKEGPLAFYKGTLAPLIGIGACVSIQFGAFHSVRQSLESYNIHHRPDGSHTLSTPQIYLAGGLAGLANTPLAGPVEHIRIRMQMQPDGPGRLYSGTGDCFRKIIRTAGINGLFRGQNPTFLREFHGFGVWFGTYEVLIRKVAEWGKTRREEIPGWKVALCGGFAGDALWFAVYPVDVLKTKMQSDGFGKERLYRSAVDAMRQTWRAHGVRGFFSGLGPTLVRTMFTSAGTFVAVEKVKNWLA